MREWKVFLASLFLIILFEITTSPRLIAQEAADFFRQNCVSCHTIGGGRLTGPDLKNVAQRKNPEWLERFIQDPKSMIDGGDPYALKLQEEARGVVMPITPGISKTIASALLALIDAESKLPKSQFAGMLVPMDPFTPKDISLGRALFLGRKPFKSGGPPCVSCHTVRGITLVGGGKLSPDLSLVFERLEGRKGLISWLSNPPTTTMRAIFKDAPIKSDEIIPLIALFESSSKAGGLDDGSSSLNFFLLGLIGALLILWFIDSVWKHRFQSVRRSLLQGSLVK